YVAPEQISGRPVDARCDVYGLACVVYETLTGHPPFLREDDMALLWAHQYDPPPPVTGVRPDLPPEADEVFARALAKNPEERHASCREFVVALRDAAAGRAQPAGSPAVPGAGRLPEPPPDWARPAFGLRGA